MMDGGRSVVLPCSCKAHQTQTTEEGRSTRCEDDGKAGLGPHPAEKKGSGKCSAVDGAGIDAGDLPPYPRRLAPQRKDAQGGEE